MATQDNCSPSGPRDAPASAEYCLSVFSPREWRTDDHFPAFQSGTSLPSPAQPSLPTGNSATCWSSGTRTPWPFQKEEQTTGAPRRAEASRLGDKGRIRHPVLGFRTVSGHSPGLSGELASLLL